MQQERVAPIPRKIREELAGLRCRDSFGWQVAQFLEQLNATLEKTSARIVFLAVLPEYRRRGIGIALHQGLTVHIPRKVAFVGGYALLDSPVIPFLVACPRGTESRI